MDESLFLVPAPDTAGQAVDNFCLGVIHVHEVGRFVVRMRSSCNDDDEEDLAETRR